MKEERVLVVPASVVGVGNGFFPDHRRRRYRDFLSHARFMERKRAEEDRAWKQLIPYLAVIREDACFLMRRGKKQSEARLHDRYSLGIGGHINEAERHAADPIEGGLLREMREEVVFTPSPPRLHYLGLINDDESEVGKVHVGLFFLALLSGGEEVRVGETDRMTGCFVPWRTLAGYRGRLEGWSRILLDAFWCRGGRGSRKDA